MQNRCAIVFVMGCSLGPLYGAERGDFFTYGLLDGLYGYNQAIADWEERSVLHLHQDDRAKMLETIKNVIRERTEPFGGEEYFNEIMTTAAAHGDEDLIQLLYDRGMPVD